jgi:hypothetical protein
MSDDSRQLVYPATVVVLVHAVPLALHAAAHRELGILFPPPKNLLILLLFVLGPFVSLGLLWTTAKRLGAWLLLGSMLGSLAFGVYHHFVLHNPDYVAQVAAHGWGTVFRVTAVLLALVEMAGCYVPARWLLAVRQHIYD